MILFSDAISTVPILDSSCSFVMWPGRSIMGILPEKSNTVDSKPTLQSPPSKIEEILEPNSSCTCLDRVGLILPEILALGAATGMLARSNNSFATG